MHPLVRKLFPYAALLLCLGSIAWAVSFGTLPRADFTFNNESEVKTIDPAKATGQPENRVINGLFEGLMRTMPTSDEPNEQGLIPLAPAPAVAESLSLSEDGRVYTFKIRPTAKWSDGSPMTAGDFVWSWRRTLHPDTGSEYAYQLYYLVNAKKYNTSSAEPGDRVEVEIGKRADDLQPFPRATVLLGTLKEVVKPPEPELAAKASKEEKSKAEARWTRQWVYVVEIKGEEGKQVDWEAPGKVRAFCAEPTKNTPYQGEVEKCYHTLVHFAEVGAKATDDQTLVVTLRNRTPYFTELAAFYPLYPVNPRCVEKHGTPGWTKAGNIVSNGPFKLEFRRIRDRVRMVKNEHYWNAANVKLQTIDAMAVTSETTALNMFLNGQLDWATKAPNNIIPELKSKPYYKSAPQLTTYFYRVNVTRPPLDNKLVRQALNMAINKQEICEFITKAGQQPARSFVPPGLKGYVSPQCGEFNPEKAKELLAQAGYGPGRPLPKIQILFNTSDAHNDIAQVIERNWKTNLGIEVELRNLEWGTFLDTLQQKDYSVARSGWVADYPDPNTYLDMFVKDGTQNQTGWSNKEYDDLIKAAAAEADTAKRAEILANAEAILMDEQPILPIYFYVSNNLVSARVKGFSQNIQDQHNLELLSVDP